MSINAGVKILEPNNPLLIGGLAYLLDSIKYDEFTFDVENISEADELSGYNNTISQGTFVNKPLYVENGFGGKPVIRFDGNDRLLRASPPSLRIVGNITIIASIDNFQVKGSNSYICGQQLHGSESLAGNMLYALGMNPSSNPVTFWEYGSGVNVQIASSLTVPATPSFLSLRRDITLKEVDFQVNESTENIGYADNPAGGTSSAFSLGDFSSGFNWNFIGDLGLLAIYNRRLSDAELEKIKIHIDNKRGI